ncbi:MAG: hypothetical protein SFX72_09460 [Isosphaeraceae bacterium]|nr:hypothetical protein [Isosphaeraceae bacterium]
MMKWFRPIVLGSLLFAAGSTLPVARAQEEVAQPGGEEEGNGPVPGYIAAGLLAALAIMFLCKSARR